MRLVPNQPQCDPRSVGPPGLIIKSLVQTIIRPEMAGHFSGKIKECEINFFFLQTQHVVVQHLFLISAP